MSQKRQVAEDDELSSATVIVADVIAQHAKDVADSNNGNLGFCNYPYCRPPFERTFIEFPCIASQDIHGFKAIGSLVEYGEDQNSIETAEALYDVFCEECDKKEKARQDSSYFILKERFRPSLVARHTVYVDDRGSIWPLAAGFMWMCDHDGTVKHWFPYPLLSLRGSDDYSGRAKCEGNVLGAVGWNLHIVAMAFTFANCANVKLEDVTEQEQPPEKIRRRLKLPCVKRYTLNIAGHSTKPRREGPGEPQTGIMPFHLCRGHFATYTAEKPMFGNPKLVGRYWHPPHMKGREERGKIEKDYRIDG